MSGHDPFGSYFPEGANSVPLYDPETGEVFDDAPPVGHEVPTPQDTPAPAPTPVPTEQTAPAPASDHPPQGTGIEHQIFAATQAIVQILNHTAKEDTAQRLGSDLMTTQNIAKTLVGEMPLIKTETLATQKTIAEISNLAEGRDLTGLKDDLNRTIENLNRAIAARSKRPLNKKLIAVIAGVTMAICTALMVPALTAVYPAEVTTALDTCQQAASRDQKAYTCNVVVRP